MEFIDLKAQQERIKAKIDVGIQKVLTHGQYIVLVVLMVQTHYKLLKWR